MDQDQEDQARGALTDLHHVRLDPIDIQVPLAGPALTEMRSALASASGRRAALTSLSQLDVSFTERLIAEVVGAALSHRDALLAREVVGRLRWRTAARLVPPVVDAMLQEADDDAYRRLAELLDHLGLFRALSQLCERAGRSTDADVREVGDDFRALLADEPV